MELTRIFLELNKMDADIAGGKGASLGEMSQTGIPVPPGFVVLATTFDEFIKESHLFQEIDSILDQVNHKDINSVEMASEKIQALVRHAVMPESIAREILSQFKELNTEYVAVRSSATAEDGAEHAWAGQLDSYLNIKEENLLEKVQHCWASLFTPRAIFYRFEKGLHDTKISVAVVVQKMVNSEVSGIAFSVHPVTEDRNQMIIEAGFGLGEAIVSGSVTPDSYVVEKEPRRIIDVNVSTQSKGMYRISTGGSEWQDLPEPKASSQVLNESQILEFADLIMRIENHYGFPCDIEWAFEQEKFYITQSRPITTLSEKTLSEPSNKIAFVRDYTRDFSIIVEDAWSQGIINVYKNILKVEMPSPVPCVYFINNGVIEVWDNTKTFSQLKNELLSYNSKHPEFINTILESFHEKLLSVQATRKQGGVISSIEEFKVFLEIFFKAVEEWIIFDYTAKHPQTPPVVRDACHKIRDIDTIWDDADFIIRSTLKNAYPDLSTYGTTILAEEIENPPPLGVLKKRFETFVFIPGEYAAVGNLDLLTNRFYFDYPKGEFNQGALKGERAFGSGVIQGIVRVIRRKEEAKTVQAGEVLVSPMTTPDYVEAMKRAAVVVTDEGGITCHAAIVAREMKIPCLTGTQVGTQIFNDGDVVSVDLHKGTVRLLEKKLPRWEKVLQRNFPPFAATASGRFEFEGFKVGPMTWIREREILIRYKTVQMYMIQDPGAFYISNIKDLLNEEHSDFENAIDKINADVYEGVRVAPGKTLEDLKKLNELHRYMYGVMLIGFDVAIDIKAKIDDLIKNNDVEFQSYLATPVEKTGVQREKDAILNAGKNPSEKVLEELVYDFGYIHQDYLGKPWTINDYKEAVADTTILPSGMHESYDVSHYDPQKQYLIRIFRKMIYMYEEGRNAMVRVCWAMKETVATLGFDPEAMLYMTETEVQLFAEGKGSYTSDELLKERKEAFAMYFEAGKYYEYTGTKAVWKFIQDQKIEYIWQEEKQNENMLKGTVAYKGKVVGKARIVFTQEEANQVEDGEILISPMTQVEFLSGIRKCGAIVTDEGGIICHAAIVAREFGKPCILATQKATKVFKTGDMVEVDADNGVVRLVEKNESINFTSKNWKKNWAGGWATLPSAYLGYQYTKQLKDVLGVSLEEALFVSHGALTACYFIDEHKKEFGAHFAKQSIENPEVVREWASKLKDTTDKARKIMKEFSAQDFNQANFETFMESIYEYGIYHRIAKVSVDYLPENILRDNIDVLSEARVYSEPVYEEMENCFQYLAGKIATKENTKPELILAMTRSQFTNYLAKNTLPEDEVLETQHDGTVMYFSEGNEVFYTGEAVAKIEQDLLDKTTNTKQLSGQTAYKGKVSGRVRIILDPTKAYDFNEGEILVTGMTRPEYLSIVEKSAGFITDAGGILSHAAITARELKKPCVIGTEVATKILKDGDLVEIDADNAVITILG